MRIAGTYSRTARKLEKLEHTRESVAFHVPPIRRPPGTPADRTGQRLIEYAGTCIDPLGLSSRICKEQDTAAPEKATFPS